jgi:hypothetical protein
MPYPVYSSGVCVALHASGRRVPLSFCVEWDMDSSDCMFLALAELCVRSGYRLMSEDDYVSDFETAGSFRPVRWKQGVEPCEWSDAEALYLKR